MNCVNCMTFIHTHQLSVGWKSRRDPLRTVQKQRKEFFVKSQYLTDYHNHGHQMLQR